MSLVSPTASTLILVFKAYSQIVGQCAQSQIFWALLDPGIAMVKDGYIFFLLRLLESILILYPWIWNSLLKCLINYIQQKWYTANTGLHFLKAQQILLSPVGTPSSCVRRLVTPDPPCCVEVWATWMAIERGHVEGLHGYSSVVPASSNFSYLCVGLDIAEKRCVLSTESCFIFTCVR